MDSLKWMFSLYDGVSGPAGRMQRSLDSMTKAVDAIPSATAVAQQGLDMLISGATRLAGLAWDAGSFAVGALAFKESTLATFELMLGTKEQAKQLFDQAKGFGKLTPFETKDVVKSFKDLLMAGFTKAEVPIVFQAVGDVAAGNNFDKSVMDRLTLVMGQIRGAGKLMGNDLLQLNNAGVGRSIVFDAIAKLMHVKPSQMAKLMEQGKVSADVAIAGILDAIKSKYSGGKALGQGMLTQATTLSGLFSTISSAPFDAFLNIDLEQSKGFQGLKAFTNALTQTLNPDSEAGQKMQALIEGIVNDVGGWLGSVKPEDFVAGFAKAVEVIGVAIDGVVAFKDGLMWVLGPTMEFLGLMDGGQDKASGFKLVMSALGAVLGGILNTIVLVVIGVGQLFDSIGKLGDYLSGGTVLADMAAFGWSLMQGLGDGILQAFGIPVAAIKSVGGGLIDAFKDVLGIHSPSKVFEELGAFTAQGFTVGLNGAGGQVDSAVTSMVRTPSSGRSSGSSPVVNLTVQVDAQGNDADAIARKLAELLPSQLASAFEQIALEGGVA